jgi:hypothetical protein
MRKVILFVQVSLDGFFEGPKKEIDWHMVDDELHAHFIEELEAMGAFLSGRVTYELMAGFWPTADADPGSTPPVKEFARIWRDMPKVVYSKTLTSAVEHDRGRGAGEVEAQLGPVGISWSGGGIAAPRGWDLIDSTGSRPPDPDWGEAFFPSKEKVCSASPDPSFGNGVNLLRYERLRPGSLVPGKAVGPDRGHSGSSCRW